MEENKQKKEKSEKKEKKIEKDLNTKKIEKAKYIEKKYKQTMKFFKAVNSQTKEIEIIDGKKMKSISAEELKNCCVVNFSLKWRDKVKGEDLTERIRSIYDSRVLCEIQANEDRSFSQNESDCERVFRKRRRGVFREENGVEVQTQKRRGRDRVHVQSLRRED